jgi:SAM-dependent methyltransferase
MLDNMTRSAGGRLRALGLAYPDLLATRQQLTDIFGPGISDGLSARPDSAGVNAWHGTAALLPEIYDTVAFFSALGVTLDCVDIRPSRGIERVVDMNGPLPEDMAAAYDLVLDLGTLEHCFNVGQAFANAAAALRAGGCILHVNPLNAFNHGFYNFSPTFYADFYECNGFTVLYQGGLAGPRLNQSHFDLPLYDRFADVPAGTHNVVVARRMAVQPIVWPTQRKYRINPALKA